MSFICVSSLQQQTSPWALQRGACRNRPSRSTPCCSRYLSPFPYSTSKCINGIVPRLTFFPLEDYNEVSSYTLTTAYSQHPHHNNTYHIVINLLFETIWWWLCESRRNRQRFLITITQLLNYFKQSGERVVESSFLPLESTSLLEHRTNKEKNIV